MIIVSLKPKREVYIFKLFIRNMNWKRGLGIGLMFIGLFLVVTNAFITGAVVGVKPENYLGLLGIFLFMIGIFLTVSTVTSGSLEEQVESLGSRIAVYETRKGPKTDEKNYFMKDPEAFFTIEGSINLRDFKDMYNVIKDDPELLERAREVYGKSLLSITQGRDKHKAEIAEEFLNILYEGKIPTEKKPLITKEEKETIKNAFIVGWRGDFNGAQKGILKNYHLGHEKMRAGHLGVYSLENPGLKITTGSTPSDYRVGIKFSIDLIHFIERLKKGERNN